jgi:hypothetical protein
MRFRFARKQWASQRTLKNQLKDSANRSPRVFLNVVKISELHPILDWKRVDGRKHVDILNFQTAKISGIQIEHLASGHYVDRRMSKKYGCEEDSKGRHYFEVIA